jgi:hypothetical protein
MRAGDRVNALRRHGEQRVDQAWALARHRVGPRPDVVAFDGDPRVALVTVNRSTTRYLKLMLLTLSEQEHLEVLDRIVVVDNHSRDGGDAFVTALGETVPTVETVHNRSFLNHARGLRSGMRALERADAARPTDQRANIVLFCDPDVIWRNPEALVALVAALTVHDGAMVGELRRSNRRYPDVQASFLGVRRDWLARRDIRPPVNHGSPTLWLQESVWEAGGVVVDFPSNLGGYVLHRGRAAVEASREYAPRSSYATAPGAMAHFMGVSDGFRIWDETEARWASWLAPERESALIARLAERFSSP